MFGQHNPFGDIFGQMHRQQVRRNRDLNIQCSVSFIDSYHGKQLEANYRLPSGRNQNVVINVPAGVSHGDTIRYPGLGDDGIAGAQRGNLNVTILVQPDPNYERRGDDLYQYVELSPIEAMIGVKKKITSLTGQQLDLDIRAGVEHGTEFASNGTGFPNVNTGYKGRFVSIIKIKTPAVTNPEMIEKLRTLDAELSKRS
jgi:DnaJ-class molecular chaperone